MDESAAPVKRPRFPWPVAILCAASLGVATWTWMRYSYAWDVTRADLVRATTRGGHNPLAEAYVRPGTTRSWHNPWVGAYVRLGESVSTRDPLMIGPDGTVFASVGPETFEVLAAVQVPYDPDLPGQHGVEFASVSGRVAWDKEYSGTLVVDSRSSRFHRASITGLVVGAMGVFVFAVYLRTWVKGRRARG